MVCLRLSLAVLFCGCLHNACYADEIRSSKCSDAVGYSLVGRYCPTTVNVCAGEQVVQPRLTLRDSAVQDFPVEFEWGSTGVIEQCGSCIGVTNVRLQDEMTVKSPDATLKAFCKWSLGEPKDKWSASVLGWQPSVVEIFCWAKSIFPDWSKCVPWDMSGIDDVLPKSECRVLDGVSFGNDQAGDSIGLITRRLEGNRIRCNIVARCGNEKLDLVCDLLKAEVTCAPYLQALPVIEFVFNIGQIADARESFVCYGAGSNHVEYKLPMRLSLKFEVPSFPKWQGVENILSKDWRRYACEEDFFLYFNDKTGAFSLDQQLPTGERASVEFGTMKRKDGGAWTASARDGAIMEIKREGDGLVMTWHPEKLRKRLLFDALEDDFLAEGLDELNDDRQDELVTLSPGTNTIKDLRSANDITESTPHISPVNQGQNHYDIRETQYGAWDVLRNGVQAGFPSIAAAAQCVKWMSEQRQKEQSANYRYGCYEIRKSQYGAWEVYRDGNPTGYSSLSLEDCKEWVFDQGRSGR